MRWWSEKSIVLRSSIRRNKLSWKWQRMQQKRLIKISKTPKYASRSWKEKSKTKKMWFSTSYPWRKTLKSITFSTLICSIEVKIEARAVIPLWTDVQATRGFQRYRNNALDRVLIFWAVTFWKNLSISDHYIILMSFFASNELSFGVTRLVPLITFSY